MENKKGLQNLYEVRKTVRFELKPYKKTRELLKWENNYDDLDSFIKHLKEDEFEKDFNWNQFCVNQYDNFLEKSKNIYNFLEEINSEIKKDNWMVKKSIQFDFKRAKWKFKNIPTLKKIQWFESLKEKLSEIEKEYENIIVFFNKIKTNKENKNEKQSEVSKYLRKLSYLNRNFLTIFSFLWQNQWKETDKETLENYQKLLNKLWDDFEKTNNSIIASHENEVTWACIWKFSLNKFSLFRREVETLKEKYKKNKELNLENVMSIISNKKIFKDNWKNEDIEIKTIKELKLEKENEDLQYKIDNFDFERNLDEVISELDLINWQLLNNYIQEFKEKYKSDKNIINVEFETYIKDWIKKEKFKNWTLKKLYDKDHNLKIKLLQWQKLFWYKYLYLINKDIINWKEKQNKELANKFLRIIFKLNNINKDYNTIKSFRDKLAKYRWKIRQDLNTTEREFINEAMIKYYAKILEKDDNFFLALIPKKKIWKELKNIEIEKHIKNNIFWNTFKIYNYSQLHFWALEKLCLMKDSTLLKNNDLLVKWDKYKNQKDKTINIDLEIFKNHIINSLEKLKENSWEDWTSFISEINKLWTIEEIVNFINEKFYKFSKQEIKTEKLFELAEKWEIELYQIYSKDFNILNDNFLSWEDEYLTELEEKLEYSEKEKTISKTKRDKNKIENLFTLYFKEIFKNTDTYLWQEWWVFFRKWDIINEHKRFRSNKFFISFDLIFNKWKQNHEIKLSYNKTETINEHLKSTTINFYNNIKNNKEIIIMWIDRGSLSNNISDKNNKISMIWYSIIKLKKENWNYKLIDIIEAWDINKLKKWKNWVWEIISKSKNTNTNDNIIDLKNILKELKEKIEKELEKSGKRDVIKIIEKKKWLTGILVNKITELFIIHKVDYISLENLDNIFEDEKSFKKIVEENTLSAYLYQTFEVQLFNKLQYIILKNININNKQFFPIYKIDEIKTIDTNKWFNKEKNLNKLIWSVIFIKTAWTSSVCFNCNWAISKHWLKCSNCWIELKNNWQKLDLKNYKEDFITKEILEKQDIQKKFNNDARAWLVIAKKWLEYLNSLSN